MDTPCQLDHVWQDAILPMQLPKLPTDGSPLDPGQMPTSFPPHPVQWLPYSTARLQKLEHAELLRTLILQYVAIRLNKYI